MKKFIYDDRHSNIKGWRFKLSTFMLYVRAYLITLCTGRQITHVFYYSKKQNNIASCFSVYSPPFFKDATGHPYHCTFNGIPYSQMSELKYGWCNWEDAKIVGFGSDADIKFI